MAQKYWHHIGARDVLGKKKLNEGKELSNQLFIISEKRGREGERGERGLITFVKIVYHSEFSFFNTLGQTPCHLRPKK